MDSTVFKNNAHIGRSSGRDILGRTPFPTRRRLPVLPTDNRARPRLSFYCTIRWSDGGADRHGIARDASEIGVGFTVRALSKPMVEQNIRLVFELDDGYEWVVDDRAVVTRCDPRPDGLCDIGVRLRQIDM